MGLTAASFAHSIFSSGLVISEHQNSALLRNDRNSTSSNRRAGAPRSRSSSRPGAAWRASSLRRDASRDRRSILLTFWHTSSCVSTGCAWRTTAICSFNSTCFLSRRSASTACSIKGSADPISRASQMAARNTVARSCSASTEHWYDVNDVEPTSFLSSSSAPPPPSDDDVAEGRLSPPPAPAGPSDASSSARGVFLFEKTTNSRSLASTAR
mmetsp:Transcript_4703/g.14689  ORF Transcript_4703/g.14689 Transcript_4703/m.14689 type:complete len:212 (+) Transcript_4703:1011-1646(+)